MLIPRPARRSVDALPVTVANRQRPIVPTPPRLAAKPMTTIVRIDTEPGIADRLAIPNRPPAWARAGDQELLRSLADAGHPAGLIYVNGQAILLSR
jgi:hypothetical protein